MDQDTEAAAKGEHRVVIDLLGLDWFPVVAASYSDLLDGKDARI